MKETLIQMYNLLPAAAIVFVIAYFYARKKAPELLMMLIAYVVVLLVSAASMYMPYYIQAKAATVEEMQTLYKGISIVSLLAHILFAVGLGILLSRYPDRTEQRNTSF